jgi:hypothetical protein
MIWFAVAGFGMLLSRTLIRSVGQVHVCPRRAIETATESSKRKQRGKTAGFPFLP